MPLQLGTALRWRVPATPPLPEPPSRHAAGIDVGRQQRRRLLARALASHPRSARPSLASRARQQGRHFHSTKARRSVGNGRAVATPNHATLPWMRHSRTGPCSNKRNTALDAAGLATLRFFLSLVVVLVREYTTFARLRRRGSQQRRDPLDVLAVHEGVVVERARTNSSRGVDRILVKTGFCIACAAPLTPANTMAKAIIRQPLRVAAILACIPRALVASSAWGRVFARARAMAGSAGGRGRQTLARGPECVATCKRSTHVTRSQRKHVVPAGRSFSSSIASCRRLSFHTGTRGLCSPCGPRIPPNHNSLPTAGQSAHASNSKPAPSGRAP